VSVFTAEEVQQVTAARIAVTVACQAAAAREWAERRKPLEAAAIGAGAALEAAEKAREDSWLSLGIAALEADQAEAARQLAEAATAGGKGRPLADRVQARQRRLALAEEAADIDRRLAEARSQHNPKIIAAMAAEQDARMALARLDRHDEQARDPLALPLATTAGTTWYQLSGLLFERLSSPDAVARKMVHAILLESGLGAEYEAKIRALATSREAHAKGLFVDGDGLPLITAPIGFDASRVPPEPPGGRPTIASAVTELDGARALAGLADMGGPVAGALRFGKG
jgi:hypothetical protein